MMRCVCLKACVACGLTMAVWSLGCSHGLSSSSTRVRQEGWTANLDGCREVSLSFDRVTERTEGEPNHTYEQLRVKVRPRPELGLERVVERVDVEPGVGGGAFRFDAVEIRVDEERRRVWFVDIKSGRVIATLDRKTGAATGPDDEVPRWATVDGGVRLDPVE